MKISVVIPAIGRPSFQNVYEAAQEADEVIVSRTGKQLVENLNEGIDKATGDFIVFLSERGEPCKYWTVKMLSAFKKIQYSGIVSFHPNIVQAGAVSRDYLEGNLGGYFYWPDYIHYHADQELGERARRDGKYAEQIDIITEHLKPKNDVFNTLNEKAAEIDSATFYERERIGFPNIRIK